MSRREGREPRWVPVLLLSIAFGCGYALAEGQETGNRWLTLAAIPAGVAAVWLGVWTAGRYTSGGIPGAAMWIKHNVLKRKLPG